MTNITEKPTYPQDWHNYNLAKTQEKILFYQLLFELCQIIPEPNHLNGRPPIPIKDLVFCLGLKLYSNYSGRKVSSDLKNAQLAGYISKAPHFNTLHDFLNSPIVYDLLQRLLTISAIPLKLLEDSCSIDSSGFGTYSNERWSKFNCRVWDNEKDNELKEEDYVKRKSYLKGHIVIGTRSHVIISCEITGACVSDVSPAEELLDNALTNFNIKQVSADKAYSSKRLLEFITSLSAMPYIPFKHNAIPHKQKDIWTITYNYFTNKREEFMKLYHKRSNVESVFASIKRRLGEYLKCKNFESQRCELLMKFIVYNITVLIEEIFVNDIHIDFREALKLFVDRKVQREQEKKFL